MPLATDIFINCDDLENLPQPNKDNYIYEETLLEKQLQKNANVLQVGSMDGRRIIRLLEIRPDLQLTGLDIEEDLIKIAEQNVDKTNSKTKFVLGDITNPPANLPHYDYVLCLNNTLGYIPDNKKAIEEMKKLGNIVIISVYGEKFDDELARKYFAAVQSDLLKIENNQCIMKDSTRVKRYTKEEVTAWNGKVVKTPIGYFCSIA